ncbi:MAG: adenylyl-sulfate reductase subunit beta [Nitrososphaerota archaeon]|nr:adenylyl-sulfate reductase subunit beta [Nitrososphaerota archaeon]MDG6927529.1 adenylyl-sulfate reductase subunit beta [Nitrososphaerota archaeon]MDG6930881.1 adenylyl-sulfate reductase subunit beta [Nitrososphaerota archaeon]MDG6932462.1 adenylyl-sulfate reductase subunit beta [Nitrososphaerota archaeon]MDG6936072.1 adenylyl-sulfate reductase subunit beta [Nitrososphaerota archaeon]
MPSFIYVASCDGCGQCVDICPSDILHIDKTMRRAYNMEPDYCWECYSCVKACPQNAVDMRGYADISPLGHSVTVARKPDEGKISWKIKYRNGQTKEFTFPIRTTKFGSIKSPAELEIRAQIDDQLLSHEPEIIGAVEIPVLRGKLQ